MQHQILVKQVVVMDVEKQQLESIKQKMMMECLTIIEEMSKITM